MAIVRLTKVFKFLQCVPKSTAFPNYTVIFANKIFKNIQLANCKALYAKFLGLNALKLIFRESKKKSNNLSSMGSYSFLYLLQAGTRGFSISILFSLSFQGVLDGPFYIRQYHNLAVA